MCTISVILNTLFDFMTNTKAGHKLPYMQDCLSHVPRFLETFWEYRSILDSDNERLSWMLPPLYKILCYSDRLHQQFQYISFFVHLDL